MLELILLFEYLKYAWASVWFGYDIFKRLAQTSQLPTILIVGWAERHQVRSGGICVSLSLREVIFTEGMAGEKQKRGRSERTHQGKQDRTKKISSTIE